MSSRRMIAVQFLVLVLSAPIHTSAQQAETSVTCNDAVEPNVLRDGANDVLHYGDHTESCAISEGVDNDQFLFDGKVGEVVRVSVRSQANGLDPSIEIFGPDQLEIGSDKVCAGDGGGYPPFQCSVSRDLELEQAGPYSIVVTDSGMNEFGSYRLQLERLWPRPDAAAVPYNATIVDGLSPTSDLDAFSFKGADKTRIRLSVQSLTNGLDPLLEIRDPLGTPLTLDPSFCVGKGGGYPPFMCSFNPAPELALTMNGTYSLLFSDSNIDDAGGYQFAVNCLLGSCPGFQAQALDSFDLYSPQSDSIGETLGDDLVYSVRADGGGGEGVVGSLSGPLAVATSLRRRGRDVVWELTSEADGSVVEGSPVMKASLPGLTSGSVAGDFATLFQHNQNLMNQSFAVAFEKPDAGKQCKLSASLVAVDRDGNRSAGPRFPIDSEGALVELPFRDLLNPLTTVEADLLNIARIDIEFYAETNGAPAASCLIDDAEIKLLAPPVNDIAISAALLGRGKRTIGTLTEATVDGPGPNPDVWYKLVSPNGGIVEIDTCGTGEYGIDTLLSLHSAVPATLGNQLVANDDWTNAGTLSPDTTVRCQQRGVPADAAVRAIVTAGQTVWVRVTRPAGPGSGPFLLAAPEADGTAAGGAAVVALWALGAYTSRGSRISVRRGITREERLR